jgi:hypothetical protein
MGSDDWFYVDSGRTVGPLSSEDMKDLFRTEVIKFLTLVKLGEAREWELSGYSHKFYTQIELPARGSKKSAKNDQTVENAAGPVAKRSKGLGKGDKPKKNTKPRKRQPTRDRKKTTPAPAVLPTVIPELMPTVVPELMPTVISTESRKRCPMCAEWILSAAKKCRYCQSSLVKEWSKKGDSKVQESSVQRRVACCARCGSSNLATSKVGFGLGKAILGTIALGPLGALGGVVGSNKLKITCLECGLEMSPGSGR